MVCRFIFLLAGKSDPFTAKSDVEITGVQMFQLYLSNEKIFQIASNWVKICTQTDEQQYQFSRSSAGCG